jgi:hypothetical protein
MASSSSPRPPLPPSITDWLSEYDLSKPCACTKKIQNSDSIILKIEYDEKYDGKRKFNRITGFYVLIIGEPNRDEAIKRANQQAKRLVDLLSFKRGKRVPYAWKAVQRITETGLVETTGIVGRISTSNLRAIELDLQDKGVKHLIENAEEINHRLHHFSLALGAEELQLFANMFTELFQVIEDANPANRIQDYEKYEALRNAISHRTLNPKKPRAAMAQVKRWYPHPNDFEFTKDNEFDSNSEKNEKQLGTEAFNLKKAVLAYLSTRL